MAFTYRDVPDDAAETFNKRAAEPEQVASRPTNAKIVDRLRAIHLNDSLNTLGSHKDRHAKIGEGNIGLEALVRVINHPALRSLPFNLETPNELDGYAAEIKLLKSLRTDD